LILPGKRKFYEAALSVITIILPSEKSRKAAGTCLKHAKVLDRIDPGPKNSRRAAITAPSPFTRNLPSVRLSVRIDPLEPD
jgi:hypothetical protein